jgi:hypothetical protein
LVDGLGAWWQSHPGAIQLTAGTVTTGSQRQQLVAGKIRRSFQQGSYCILICMGKGVQLAQFSQTGYVQ